MGSAASGASAAACRAREPTSGSGGERVGDFDGIGHPPCSFPIGFGTDATTGFSVPRGAVLGGPPFAEQRILSVIAAYQALTDFHRRRPPDPTVTLAAAAARTAAAFTIDADAQPPDET